MVHDFVRDLNNRNISGLQSDLRFDTPGGGLGKGDRSSVVDVLAHAELPWNITGVTIEGMTPTVSSAYVTGTAGGSFITLSLPLFREHGRWYITLRNPENPQAASG